MFFGDPYVDALGDGEGVVAGFRHVRKEFAHLLGRLDVELIHHELHAARILDRLARPDAQQHVVRLRVGPVEVVRIVRGDERQIHLAGKLDQPVVDDVLLRDAVPHHFDVEAIAEDVDKRPRGALRALVVVAQQGLRDQRRHTSGKNDQPVVMAGQKIHVDARLVVVAFEKPLRDERHEIPIADDIGCQQRDVGFVAHRAVEAAARRDIRFTPDDRNERMLVGRVIELHRPEHHAVIRQRDAGRTAVGRAAAQILDAASSI